MVVVSLGARNIGRVTHKLPTIANYVDYIYLVSDDVESADDAYQAAQLEPLYQSEHVPIEDTVVCDALKFLTAAFQSYNAEQLAESGVPLEKIVIGLSLWARSYRLVDVHERGHNAPARGYGQWDEDPRGRVPHKEVKCHHKNLVKKTK